MSEDRLTRVRALLRREGVRGRVAAAGQDGEIVAVEAPTEALGMLRELAPEIRSYGFRYVALDLTGHAD